jgi:hypothetical protein
MTSRQVVSGFRTPAGEVYSTHRAVTYDNWLLWIHALPDNPELWRRMDEAAFATIQVLGKRLHLLHQMLPNYRRLSDTPFTVSRWWDPLDNEDDWHLGGRCLLRIDGFSCRQLPLDAAPKLGLVARPVSENWVEFSLPLDPQAAAG